MKFSSDARPGALLVRSYSASELRVGELVFTTSVILSADHHVADWPPQTPDALTVDHLSPILALAPEVVLLGTGARQVFPDPKLFAHMASRGIGFEVMDTGAACRTYNVLVNEFRKVVLAVLIARV